MNLPRQPIINLTRSLIVLVFIFCNFNLLMAKESLPFETFATSTNPAGDTVDPEWLEFCLDEGFHAAIAVSRVGTANHLGLYLSHERACLDFSLFPIIQARNIELTFHAANGDELSFVAEADFDYSGPEPTIPWGVFEFVGGTGRFENATGGGETTEVIFVDGHDSLHFVGTISFDASDRRH